VIKQILIRTKDGSHMLLQQLLAVQKRYLIQYLEKLRYNNCGWIEHGWDFKVGLFYVNLVR
jgi:hypothetical protein